MLTKTSCRIALPLLLFVFITGAKAPIPTQITAEPALSLTASDGSGLILRDLKVSSVLEGFVAFTEVELTFYNPEPRRREGRFSMLLPERASLSRFAMEIGGRWQEGELVETQKARRAYEDFLHRRQDPALMEQESGNKFSARVFPIEASSEKRLILSYSELLEGGLASYRFPLAGLPKLGSLQLSARYRGAGVEEAAVSAGAKTETWKVVTMKEKDFQPSRDFSLEIKGKLKEALGLRAGKLAALKFLPFGREGDLGITEGQRWVVMVDSSASQAHEFGAKLDRMAGILLGLEARTRPENMKMVAFDQELKELGTWDDKSSQMLVSLLKKRMALGASDFGAAIAKLEGGKGKRLLLLSDGAATAGETKAARLRELLAKKGFARVDCLSLGSFKDGKLLAELAQAGEKSGLLLDGRLEDRVLVDKLAGETGPEIVVEVPGAEWVWPRSFKGLQAGDEAIVFAEIPAGEFRVKFLGKTLSPEMAEAEPMLLKREWTKARIERLLAEEEKAADKDVKNGLHQEVIRISQTERVLSPYTSLLVLETEADYARFGIERNALTDILVVGASGLELQKRSGLVLEPMPTPMMVTRAALKRVTQDGVMASMARESGGAEAAKNGASEDVGALSLPRPAPASPAEMVAAAASAVSNVMMSAAQPEPGPALGFVESRPAAPPLDSEASRERRLEQEQADEAGGEEEPEGVEPWDGDYAVHRGLLKAGKAKEALAKAKAWYLAMPEDALALLALGESFQALGKEDQAARAYGSLIDHFPSRADIRRWAAGRLLSLKAATALAIDSLEKAREQRPDHASTVALLASAYLQAGKKAMALKVMEAGSKANFSGGCEEIQRILGVLGALAGKDGAEKAPDLGFLLTWETDANDVDFHIYDAKGGHASYRNKHLKSGGELYEDVTSGYGPEFFGIPSAKAGPYRLKAHYYSRGPMGYGMGLLQVLRKDAKKGVVLEARPFVIMRDQAYLDLGTVAQP